MLYFYNYLIWSLNHFTLYIIRMKEKIFVPIIMSFFIVMTVIAFIAPGTGDAGDSIGHFLHARYAFDYPIEFFNTWAKPLYVLLAAPFAHYGFTGVKFFNVIVATLSMTAIYFTAKRLQLLTSWLACVFFALAPMNIIITLSGLTEPLFACVLICGLCLVFYEHIIGGLILLSFLPFVRSEGFFMLIPVVAYMAIIKKPWHILWLATGQIVYAIAGYFVYKNLLWYYIQNPYFIKSQYGQGDAATFIVNMPVVIGFPLSLLLCVGFITIIYRFFKKNYIQNNELNISFVRLLLIWCLFFLYFLFHTLAWGFGLFSSFGMLRYMIGVVPLIAIICLAGFNKIAQLISFENKFWVKIGVVLVFIIIPTFLPIAHIDYYNWNRDFGLQPDQVAEQKMAAYIKHKFPDYKNRTNYFDATYFAVVLDIYPFNPPHKWGWDVWKNDGSKPGSYYLWDDWYSPREGPASLPGLLSDSTLVRDTSFSQPDKWGNKRTVILFIKK